MITGLFIVELSIPSYSIQQDTDKLTVFLTVLFPINGMHCKKYRHKAGDGMALSNMKIKTAKTPEGKNQPKPMPPHSRALKLLHPALFRSYRSALFQVK